MQVFVSLLLAWPTKNLLIPWVEVKDGNDLARAIKSITVIKCSGEFLKRAEMGNGQPLKYSTCQGHD